ncbi:MAG TPA: hypothetical protein VFK86_06970 [Bauldia sp.]|nr:hypothetical protein [Bauldia sp.]
MRKCLIIFAVLLSTSSAVALEGQADPRVTLDVASTFPGTMPILGEAAAQLSERVRRATGGELVLDFHEPGELSPAAETVNAVASGDVDAAWAGAGWFAGKDSAFNFFSSVPFGPDMSEYLAWLYEGGGLELAREMFHAHDVHNIPCGLIPPEASGWFRREIKSPADLVDLKMRIFGMGALVMKKFGVITEQAAPGELRARLADGSLDAAELSQANFGGAHCVRLRRAVAVDGFRWRGGR